MTKEALNSKSAPDLAVTSQITNLELARQHLQKAIELDTQPVAAHLYGLAQVEFLAGSNVTAQKLCEKCLQLEPDNYDALLLLAEIWLRLGHPHDSCEVAKQLFKLHKNQEETWLLAARAAIAIHKPKDAIKLLELYLQKYKTQLASPLVYIVLAQALLQADLPKQALEQVEQAQARLKALALLPGAQLVALRARILHKLGRPTEAVDYYQQALQSATQDTLLHRELGDLLLQQEKYEEALKVFRQILQFEPKNPVYYYKAGLAARHSAEVSRQPGKRIEAFRKEAIELLNKAIQMNKAKGDYWYELAQVYNATGNHKLVKQTLTQLLEQVPNTTPEQQLAYLRLYASVCRKLGDLEEAVQAYRQILVLVPEDHAALNELGELLYKLGRYGVAFNHFRHAEMLSNDHPHYLANISRVLLKLGRLDEARELITEAVTYQPTHYLVRHQLGAVLLETGQANEALEHLQHAASSEPDNAEFRYYLGRAYLQLGRIRDAIGEYEKATTLAPFDPRWHAELGEIYLHERAYLSALENLRLAVQIKPTEPNYHYNLAIALAANGDLVNAIQTMQAEIQVLGSGVGAAWYYLLGRLQLELGRLDEALDSFEQAHRLEPENPHYKVDLAKTLRLKGEPIEQVRNLLEEAIEVYPKGLQSFEELAYVYEASNDLEAALRTLEVGLGEVMETVGAV